MVAPATKPDADDSDDTSAGQDSDAPGTHTRDAWILEQRPPHWG